MDIKRFTLVACGIAVILAAGCTAPAEPDSATSRDTDGPAAEETSSAGWEGDGAGSADEEYAPDISPERFAEEIDNPYLPFLAGSRWVYEGRTDEGVERIDVTVQAETRVVMGVTCTVVRDTVTLDGELVEDTLDWFAQDDEGNVWYFGEAVKDYENGRVIGTEGSWEAGVDGALPGIVMWASPETGTEYRQEYYPGEAEDMARVIQADATTTIALGSYENVLVTEEWTPLEPGVAERKYYAPDIGLVLETVRGGSGRIELVEFAGTPSDDGGP